MTYGRLGVKKSGGNRFKKLIAVGAAVGGTLLGIKLDKEITKQRTEQTDINRPTLSGLGSQFQPQSQREGERDVIGTDSQGNIIGGAKVGLAGSGVKLGAMVKPAQQLPNPLDPSKLEPFGKKVKTAAIQSGIHHGAGVVAGQQKIGGAIKGVAGAVFGATKAPKDPIALALSQAAGGAQAGASVAIGAEGIKASNKDLLGQLIGKAKKKPKKLFKFAG